jgi:PAS domain-containing protein
MATTAVPLRAVVLAQHEGLRKSIVAPLKAEGLLVVEVATESDAYRDLCRGVPDLLVCQASSEQGEDREALLVGLLATPHRPPMIVVTGDSSADVGARLVRRGAFCALRHPADPEEVRAICRRALQARQRERERAQLLIDLEAVRNLFQDAFANMLDGVLILDEQDNVLYANAEGARIMLQERTKLIGTKLDPRFCWSIFNLLKKARESPVRMAEDKFELMSGDTARLEVFTRVSTICDHSDQVVGALVVIRPFDKKPATAAAAAGAKP